MSIRSAESGSGPRSGSRLQTGSYRQWSLALVLALMTALTGACVNLDGGAPQVWYELLDLAPVRESSVPAREAGSAPAVAAGAVSASGADECVLLIAASAADSFHASTAIAYSRHPGQLALYQYARWSEPPAARIGRLLGERLQAGHVLTDVAPASGLVRGRWLLELELETLVHDDVAPPGLARLGLTLRVIDRSRARTVGLRRFDEQEALTQESAASAVAAFSRALTRVLDDAASWLPQRMAAECASAGTVGPDSNRFSRSGPG